MARRVVDRGDGLQVMRIVARVFNKYLWTADKRWSSRLGIGRGAKYFSP